MNTPAPIPETPAESIGERIVERIEQLATISEQPDGLTRCYLTDEHRRANERVADWMCELGMTVRTDAVGNLVGRLGSADGPCLQFGSHLDSVRNAGKHDGPLGVLLPLACLESMANDGVEPPVPIEVIGFCDEEGVRFGATLIGSRAAAGTLPASVLDSRDAAGTSMADALTTFGLDPARIGDAARDRSELAAYVEVHIEQGPVLEARDLPVGVVSAIAGASRYQLTVAGQAGHAGTVPMALRHDALAAAAEMALACEQAARESEDLVATIGRFEVPKGAVNVIPGSAEFSLDVRSGDDALRRAALASLEQRFAAIAARRGVTVTWAPLHENGAARCAPELRSRLAEAVSGCGHPVVELPSGAGHDAMAMADLVPVGMLFVRCRGGISHHPDEHMSAADAGAAAIVIRRFIESWESLPRDTASEDA